jgi:hypothetical protein
MEVVATVEVVRWWMAEVAGGCCWRVLLADMMVVS